ncbi:MAG: hypothetical protein FWG03_04150 [Clostridiales bacterium]|nr:hypothetical protein [Clostridiales bacterium]
MKKTAIILALLSVCFGLAGCDPVMFSYKYNELAADVVRVELIQYDNPDAQMMNSYFSLRGLRAVKEDRIEIIEVLDKDRTDMFYRDLAEAGLWNHWGHPNSPSGICLRLVFGDDRFDIISFDLVGNSYSSLIVKYDKRGRVSEYIGSMLDRDEYLELCEEYFPSRVS